MLEQGAAIKQVNVVFILSNLPCRRRALPHHDHMFNKLVIILDCKDALTGMTPFTDTRTSTQFRTSNPQALVHSVLS